MLTDDVVQSHVYHCAHSYYNCRTPVRFNDNVSANESDSYMLPINGGGVKVIIKGGEERAVASSEGAASCNERRRRLWWTLLKGPRGTRRQHCVVVLWETWMSFSCLIALVTAGQGG